MDGTLNRAKGMLEGLEEVRSQVSRLRRTVKIQHSASTRGVANYGAATGQWRQAHSERWDQLVDSQLLLEEQERQLQQKEAQLEQWIDLLPKPRWRMVLRYRYLDDLDFPEVLQKMKADTGRDFSIYQIYGFHRRALAAADQLWPLS